MRDIRMGTSQFEGRDGDKAYNLGVIARLTKQAVSQGAEIVSFQEGAVTNYTFLQSLSRESLVELAEPVPNGPSVRRLIEIANENRCVIMAGLFERDEAARVYNTYVTVGPEGFISRFRKLHTFINRHLSNGNEYCVIDLCGCQIGFLICYDNNLPENVRATALLGAEIIMAPHVTGGLPFHEPGTTRIPREVWDHRETNPAALRQYVEGPTGRGWLLKWLRARAWENGVYLVFSNPIGWDYDSVRPGCAMIIDPYGEVMAESRVLGDDVVVATLAAEHLDKSLGRIFKRSRRPELYQVLTKPQESVIEVAWQVDTKGPETR